jgi:peroxiredoxin
MSADEFDVMMAAQKARQDAVPKVGDVAPDFELEVLDRAKKRTGETVSLSSLRGKPVALLFGSYT